MGKSQDAVIGKVFGSLLVIGKTPQSKLVCRCRNCERTIKVDRDKLGTYICDCMPAGPQYGKHNLTYRKFNKLTVMSLAENVGKQGKHWKCLCECGNVTTVLGSNLTTWHTTSCGCAKHKSLVGKRFERLIAIAEVSTPHRTDISYLCECDCKNIVIVRGDALTSGRTRSCGCYAEEQRIAAVREKMFVDGTQPSKLTSAPTAANKSGVVGVNWDKARGKWQAGIRFKGKRYNLGRYEHMQDAIDARKAAEKEIFGDFLKWYENHKKGGTE